MRTRMFSVALMSILALAEFGSAMRAVAQQEAVLHNFNGNANDGYYPYGNLIFDAAGNLYGATYAGGTYGGGTVFQLSPQAGGDWTRRILHNFSYNTGDGYWPYAGLIFDAVGNLYGTTYSGGAYTYGTVFELTPTVDGRWTEKILHNFNVNHGQDGINPRGGLIFDSAGNLYGTTIYGGADQNFGAVFELTPAAGGGWAEKILHDFNFNGIDGTYPWASLVIDTSGHLYGTTVEGGAYGVGTVFELKPTAGGGWAETVLHSFNTDGSDGYNPYCALVLDGSGNLYGTTSKGGAYDFGTVFEMKIRASGSGWNETMLHSFDNITDGSSPQVGLIFDHVGSLYGTTYGGGSFYGTAFELIPGAGGNWTEKILHEFSSTNPDGHSPYGNLIFDAAGNLYGTTSGGGAYNYGTVFEVKP